MIALRVGNAPPKPMRIRSSFAGGDGEFLHRSLPPSEDKETIVQCRSLNLATRRRQCQSTTSPLVTTDAMGSRSFFFAPASIPANLHRSARTLAFSTAAQTARRNVQWPQPLCSVQRLRIPSRVKADAEDCNDARTICGPPLIRSQRT